MATRENLTRRYAVSAVERTFQIIEELAREKHGLGLTELTERLGLAKSSAFGILVTMEHLGYVEHDPETDRYKLGLRLYSIASQLAQNLDIVQVSMPLLQALVDELGETAHLGILKDGKVIYLASIEGRGPLKVAMPAGQRSDVHCTALGKVLLADQPPERRRAILSEHGLPRYTEKTVTDAGALEEELARVRAQGWAVDDEEEVEGVRCVAAPVRDAGGRAAAAVSVTGPAQRLPEQRWPEVARAVGKVAAAISQRLGYLGA